MKPDNNHTSLVRHQTFSQTNVTKVCPGSQCTFAFYGGESLYHRYIFVLQLCNLLVFLWLVNFTIALGQCTLAGAFASYYWALKKPNDIPTCPLFSSFSRAIRSVNRRPGTVQLWGLNKHNELGWGFMMCAGLSLYLCSLQGLYIHLHLRMCVRACACCVCLLQLSHRFPGFWFSDPGCGPNVPHSFGVPGSQT